MAASFIVLHTFIRIIRHFYKFPIPEFLAGAIDNPLRRRIQPPDEMALRHSLRPGMRVLDVGPGNGRYTMAAARLVGQEGRVIAIDIEPKMIERVRSRAQAEGVGNVEARVADVCDLPFDDGVFDAIYLIAVIGEIPDQIAALKEFRRVLSPSGTIAFSELLMDPDYPLAESLVRKAGMVGFRLKRRLGSFFSYTLVLEKDTAVESPVTPEGGTKEGTGTDRGCT
jgi:ubiquinone/menaquinone biosynthesis C-methylase UbiE